MIDFLKYTRIYLLISAIVIFAGLFSIKEYQFKYSIDFVGGSLINYKFDKKVTEEEIKKVFSEKKILISSIAEIEKNGYLIRSVVLDTSTEDKIRKSLTEKYSVKVERLRYETVGPTLGHETIIRTLIASFVAMIGILIYLTFAFKNLKYGTAAILAMIHDFVVLMGTYSLLSKFFGAEVDSLFVTAVLTTMSFSVHDTIVVFDKIREYKRSSSNLPFTYLANKALSETMVRSLNNSLTIILMLSALLLLGGEVIRFFVAALLIGTVTGTYSSPFIATPILAYLDKKR